MHLLVERILIWGKFREVRKFTHRVKILLCSFPFVQFFPKITRLTKEIYWLKIRILSISTNPLRKNSCSSKNVGSCPWHDTGTCVEICVNNVQYPLLLIYLHIKFGIRRQFTVNFAVTRTMKFLSADFLFFTSKDGQTGNGTLLVAPLQGFVSTCTVSYIGLW